MIFVICCRCCLLGLCPLLCRSCCLMSVVVGVILGRWVSRNGVVFLLLIRLLVAVGVLC